MDPAIGQFIPLILIFVIFYFFLIRPQQKKQKEHKKMVEELKRGDKIITSGGIIGRVERIIDNEKIEVEISDNVKVEILRTTGVQGLIKSTVDTKITLKNVILFKIKNYYYYYSFTNSFLFCFFKFY